MKKQIILLSSVILFITNSSFGQFKMTSAGNVGIGTVTPNGRMEVKGGPFFVTIGNQTLRFHPANPNPEIGTNMGSIGFWYTDVGYLNLYAKHYYTSSDSSLKEDISLIKKPFDFLNQINGYSYYFKKDTGSQRKMQYGLLANEVETVLPSVVDTQHNVKLLDYQAVLPFLLEAIKYQQQIVDSMKYAIDTLRRRIDTLESAVYDTTRMLRPFNNGSSNETLDTKLSNKNNDAIIFQNIPNPFKTSTTIFYNIPDFSQAYLDFIDMKGRFIKRVNLTKSGFGSISLNKGDVFTELFLGQDMIIYKFIVNGILIDSKIMISLNQ